MTQPLRASPPERYQAISQHLLEQAQAELTKGDLIQSSEKLWGATAHAVKALCQKMGWNHHAHIHIRDTVNYIASELARNDLRNAFIYLEALHINYYEHQHRTDEIRTGIDNATFLTRELAAIPLSQLPSSREHLSATERQDQERRLRMLTRKTQFSHGPQLEGNDLDALPPIKPATPEQKPTPGTETTPQ